MSFLRHRGIFQSDELFRLRERQAMVTRRSQPHRLDEFPVGYSWRVALQQSPLPLHQPRPIVKQRSVEGKNFFRPGAVWLNSLSHSRGALQWLPMFLLILILISVSAYALRGSLSGNVLLKSLLTLNWQLLSENLRLVVTNSAAVAFVAGCLGAALTIIRAAKAFGMDAGSVLSSVSRPFRMRDLSAPTSFRHKFAAEFKEVTQALGRRTAIFIDDLDRCMPSNVTDVLEAVNFVVTSGDCFVIMGMARNRVEGCVGLKFKDFAEDLSVPDEGTRSRPDQASGASARRRQLARDYLDKIINIEVAVPIATPEQSRDLLVGGADISRNPEEKDAGQRFWISHFRGMVAISMFTLLLVAMGFLAATAVRLVSSPPLEGPASPGPPPSARSTPPVGVIGAPTPGTDAAAGAPSGVVSTEIPGTSEVPEIVTAPGNYPGPGFWMPLVLILIVVSIGILTATRRRGISITDSKDFEDALRIWHPLIAFNHVTPRSIKRFMNRLRFIAMRERSEDSNTSLWDQVVSALKAYLVRGQSALNKARTEPKPIPESALVAMAAIENCMPEWFGGNFELDGHLPSPSQESQVRSLLREAKSNHETAFGDWNLVKNQRDRFLQLTSSVRVR